MTTREEDVMRRALEAYAKDKKSPPPMAAQEDFWRAEEGKIARQLIVKFCSGGSPRRKS